MNFALDAAGTASRWRKGVLLEGLITSFYFRSGKDEGKYHLLEIEFDGDFDQCAIAEIHGRRTRLVAERAD